MPFVIYGLTFMSVVALGLASYPPIVQRIKEYLATRVDETRVRLDDMFLDLPQHRVRLLYVGVPLGLGLFAWLLTGFWPIGLLGLGIGVVIPKHLLRQMSNRRRAKFHAQFIDCLLLLSSCLRAGLSMTQSFGVIAEEMPPPISQEFGLIMKETRMGVTLDQSMAHFRQRLPSDDTTLFVTAVLVARQTGGDVTAIFTRLVETLRERKKIRERIKTLTFMARMQGVVMAALPVLFSFAIYAMDRNHFNFFLTDPFGRTMLMVVIGLQVVGALLFMRFARAPL